jgi:hypothetical protein
MKTAVGPKYKVGLRVTAKTPKGTFTGNIVEVERVFKDIDSFSGGFERGGLCTFERDIASIQIPHTFDGETLTVSYPAQKFNGGSLDPRTRTAKFHSYCYTMQPEGLTYRVVISEKSVIKVH